MASKAKPVWFRASTGKWHRDPMEYLVGIPMTDEDVERNVKRGVLISKCGSADLGHFAPDRKRRIRRRKPPATERVCKHCDR